MKLSHAKVLITLLFYLQTAFPENIEITRHFPNDLPSKWKEVFDSFHIPQSVCDQQDSGYGNYCNTSCTAEEENDEVIYSCPCFRENATVMYLDNKWGCVENREVRDQLGRKLRCPKVEPGTVGICVQDCSADYDCSEGHLCCSNGCGHTCQQGVQVIFKDEQDTHGLYTLEEDGKERQIVLNNGQESCGINVTSSWYIGCFGEKNPLGRHTNRATDIFKLVRKGGPLPGKGTYWIKVEEVDSETELFEGRIVNLGFSCSTGPLGAMEEAGSLLFKLEGSMTCPVEPPPSPSSSISINTSPSSISPTQTELRPTASIAATVTGTDESSTGPSDGQTYSREVVSSATNSAIQVVTLPNPQGRNDKHTENIDSSPPMGIIAGAIASTIFVVLILALFVYRRRKSRKDAETSSSKINKTNAAFQPEEQYADFNTDHDRGPIASVCNPNYGMPPQELRRDTSRDNQQANSDGLYAALNIPEGHNIYGPGDNRQDGPQSDESDPVFNVVGESIDEPLYSTLDDLQPVHNLVDGSDHKSAAGFNNPVYNVIPGLDPDKSNGDGLDSTA